MNSFINKTKAIFRLLFSDRFLLIATNPDPKMHGDGDDVYFITNRMCDHDIAFFCDTFADEAEENIRIEEAIEMSNVVGNKMITHINEVNLN